MKMSDTVDLTHRFDAMEARVTAVESENIALRAQLEERDVKIQEQFVLLNEAVAALKKEFVKLRRMVLSLHYTVTQLETIMAILWRRVDLCEALGAICGCRVETVMEWVRRDIRFVFDEMKNLVRTIEMLNSRVVLMEGGAFAPDGNLQSLRERVIGLEQKVEALMARAARSDNGNPPGWHIGNSDIAESFRRLPVRMERNGVEVDVLPLEGAGGPREAEEERMDAARAALTNADLAEVRRLITQLSAEHFRTREYMVQLGSELAHMFSELEAVHLQMSALVAAGIAEGTWAKDAVMGAPMEEAEFLASAAGVVSNEGPEGTDEGENDHEVAREGQGEPKRPRPRRVIGPSRVPTTEEIMQLDHYDRFNCERNLESGRRWLQQPEFRTSLELVNGTLGAYARRTAVSGPIASVFGGDEIADLPSVREMLACRENPIWRNFDGMREHQVCGLLSTSARRHESENITFQGSKYSLPFLPRVTVDDTMSRLMRNFQGTLFDTGAPSRRRRRIEDGEFDEHLPFGNVIDHCPWSHPLQEVGEDGWLYNRVDFDAEDVRRNVHMLRSAVTERRDAVERLSAVTGFLEYPDEPDVW